MFWRNWRDWMNWILLQLIRGHTEIITASSAGNAMTSCTRAHYVHSRCILHTSLPPSPPASISMSPAFSNNTRPCSTPPSTHLTLPCSRWLYLTMVLLWLHPLLHHTFTSVPITCPLTPRHPCALVLDNQASLYGMVACWLALPNTWHWTQCHIYLAFFFALTGQYTASVWSLHALSSSDQRHAC